jgi:transposase-like protein
MKNSNTCPKCKSTAVVRVDNNYGSQMNRIQTGLFTITQISRYVCCDCGYTEEWIEKQKDLDKIRTSY